eukprot:1028055-Pleurochrysis_carterae.AAC.7
MPFLRRGEGTARFEHGGLAKARAATLAKHSHVHSTAPAAATASPRNTRTNTTDSPRNTRKNATNSPRHARTNGRPDANGRHGVGRTQNGHAISSSVGNEMQQTRRAQEGSRAGSTSARCTRGSPDVDWSCGASDSVAANPRGDGNAVQRTLRADVFTEPALYDQDVDERSDAASREQGGLQAEAAQTDWTADVASTQQMGTLVPRCSCEDMDGEWQTRSRKPLVCTQDRVRAQRGTVLLSCARVLAYAQRIGVHAQL